MLGLDRAKSTLKVQFIDAKCMAPCNHRGLALELSACKVDTSMVTISNCGVKTFVSPQTGKRNAKKWACTCIFVTFHSFIHYLIFVFPLEVKMYGDCCNLLCTLLYL